MHVLCIVCLYMCLRDLLYMHAILMLANRQLINCLVDLCSWSLYNKFHNAVYHIYIYSIAISYLNTFNMIAGK